MPRLARASQDPAFKRVDQDQVDDRAEAVADERTRLEHEAEAVLERAVRRRPKLRWLAAGLAMALVVGWALVAGQRFGRDPTLVRSPLVGKPAPDFRLTSLSGAEVTSADFAGRTYVVNFWASWCIPCAEEAPELQAFSERWSARGVGLVGIAYNDDRAKATAFRDKFALTYPQAMDPAGRAAIDFGVFGVPETYVVDRRGVVMAKLIGAVGPGTLDQVVTAVEEGRTVSTKNDRYRDRPGGS